MKPESPKDNPSTEAELAWTNPLIGWALDTLPPYLAKNQEDELATLQILWEKSRLSALTNCTKDCRVQALVELVKSSWHQQLDQQVAEIAERLLADLSLGELLELGSLAMESGLLKLAEQEDMEPAYRRHSLMQERAQLLRVRERLRAATVDCAQADKVKAKKLANRLTGICRRLHNQADEAVSLERLERIFGQRAWRYFSRFTFFLLFLLLGIITWELTADHPEEWQELLVWIDSGICFVFLLEFTLQLSCVPRRLSWFGRHFLTDFMPAIPFALIAHGGEGLELMIRSVRFLRAFRFARYLRALKPIVGLARLLVFWIRGMDRIVESMAPLLNRRIVFFDHPEEKTGQAQSGKDQDRERKIIDGFERLSPPMKEQAAPGLLCQLASSIHQLADQGITATGIGEWENWTRHQESHREIRADRAIAFLQGMGARQVEERLPPATIRGLSRLLALLNLPLIRRLPFIRNLVTTGENTQPTERVAQAGRALGRVGRKLMNMATTWADLSGVITPSQILDRVSTALIKSTQRPAVRLLLFGTLFVMLRMGIELFTTINWDGTLVGGFLNKFVATPLLVLGSVCLLVLLLARWLKKIAGEASDRLLRLSEARYANLMELLRNNWAAESRLEAAARLTTTSDECQTLDADILKAAIAIRQGKDEQKISPRTRNIALLLLDMQDGAFLHRTDTKGVEQFLSHPDLWNLRHQYLRISRKEKKQLARLDLSGSHPLSGPFFWFDMTTNALAIKLARLCSSYNLNLIPLHRMTGASKMEKERHLLLLAGEGGLTVEPSSAQPYTSSFFNFIHFLHPSPHLLTEVEREFGARTATRLQADRQRVMREVFGSRALNLLPLERRSINPFLFYQARLSRGRFLLLPLFFAGIIVKALWLVGRTSFRAAREILNPKLKGADLVDRKAPFAVAQRKLRLIKKPLLLAAIHLAARVDPTYLGLKADGSPTGDPAPMENDLELAIPTTREASVFAGVRDNVAGRLLYYESFRDAWPQAPAVGSAEENRLLAAFAMDEEHIAGLAAVSARAMIWREAASKGNQAPSGNLPKPEQKLSGKAIAQGLRLLRNNSNDKRARKALGKAVKNDSGDIRTVCYYLSLGGTTPIELAQQIAARLVAGTNTFLDARQTLHALLGIIVQDLRQHERLVHLIGNYAEEDEHTHDESP